MSRDQGDGRIDSILIVGGGTAGWLAAAYLARVIGTTARPPVKITLVESEQIGAIGVGEATIPTLRDTLRTIGVTEARFLKDCDASFKQGIRFVGWRAAGGQCADTYFHPFETPSFSDGIGAAQHWLAQNLRGKAPGAYAESVGIQAALAEAGRAPKLWTSPPYEAPVPYAYHLDAGKFGAMLRAVAESASVRRIGDEVVRVDADGERIVAVHTRANGRLEADLYIDCSGFGSLLLGKALGEPLIDYTGVLPCDRAVAMRTPYPAPDTPLRPYTTATAAEAGWIWDIDLQNRRGSGYVYASDFASPEEAERRLRAHLGPAADGCDALHLRASAGRRRRLWVGNCVALGLAGGFIEPLESTGIHLIEIGLKLLYDHFPGKRAHPPAVAGYNRLMGSLYDELRDFIVMHYCLTDRRDTPFWRHQTAEAAIPGSLAEKLELWQRKLPTPGDIPSIVCFFGHNNYAFILAGMDRLPHEFPLADFVPEERSARLFDQLRNIRDRAIEASPRHGEVITRLVGAA